jgi:hypothetical protein
VLDKSGSMAATWDHDFDPATPDVTRWHSLHGVVESMTAELEDTIDFGAQLFPAADAYLDEPYNVASCLVNAQPEVSVGPGTASAVMAAIPAATDLAIEGGTPARAALGSAIEHLDAIDPERPRAIVLVTDGAPNCSAQDPPDQTLFLYDEEVASVIADAFTLYDIPVYVVGIDILDYEEVKPAVNPSEAIEMMADAGGVPAPGSTSYYNVVGEQDLIDAMSSVLGQIECGFTLDEPPLDPDLVELQVGGEFIPHVDDCETEDGWVYTSPAGPFTSITLCGSACEGRDDGTVVEVAFVCPDPG